MHQTSNLFFGLIYMTSDCLRMEIELKSTNENGRQGGLNYANLAPDFVHHNHSSGASGKIAQFHL